MVEKYYVTSDAQDCDTIPYDFVLATALANKHYPANSGLYYIRTFAYEKTGNVVKNGVQLAYRYNDPLAYQYQRKCYNGEWSEWVLLPTRDEVNALNKKLSVEFISSNQTKTFTVTNPCWIFINEADDAMFFGMASGSRVNAIENSLVEVSIARPNNTSISITNNQSWGIRMWLLQF